MREEALQAPVHLVVVDGGRRAARPLRSVVAQVNLGEGAGQSGVRGACGGHQGYRSLRGSSVTGQPESHRPQYRILSHIASQTKSEEKG